MAVDLLMDVMTNPNDESREENLKRWKEENGEIPKTPDKPKQRFKVLYDVRYSNGFMVFRADSKEDALAQFKTVPLDVLIENCDGIHTDVEATKPVTDEDQIPEI